MTGPSSPEGGPRGGATSRAPAIPNERWLLAGLSLCRLAAADGPLVERALPWIAAVSSEVGGLPPPGVVVDVGLLLGGASLDTTAAMEVVSPRLRAALVRYEDRVLGRLFADRRLTACRDALARLPPALAPAAVAVLVGSLAEGAALRACEPGVIRRLMRRAPEELVARGFDTWRETPEVLDVLARGYESLTEATRATPSLLADADVFTLENLHVLEELGQRVAIGQVLDAAEAMAAGWPRRVKLRRAEAGPTPTALEDESAFPAGGFTSMANHGALENLVTSELVYMESRREEGTVDLFDVRYAEGELLYYTRDEALIVRPRRFIAFVVRGSLAAARLKDPGVRWQRVVVMLGWVVASIRALTRWLGETELSFACIFEHTEGQRDALSHEHQLMELLLREWRDKGMADVSTATAPGWQERLAAAATRADVRVVLLGAGAETAPPPGITVVSFDARERSWDAWGRDGLEALRELV